MYFTTRYYRLGQIINDLSKFFIISFYSENI